MTDREKILVLQAQLHELLAENATLKLSAAKLENTALKVKVGELEAAAKASVDGTPADPADEAKP